MSFSIVSIGVFFLVFYTVYGFVVRLRPHRTVFLAEYLSTLCKRGLPLADGLAAYSLEQKGKFALAVGEIAEALRHGLPLSRALGQYPKQFPSHFVSTLRAGEESGTLPEMLDTFACHDEKRAQEAHKLAVVLLYPFLAMPVLLGALTVIVVKIVPQFQTMFDEMGLDLPWSTQTLVGISNEIRGAWYLAPASPFTIIGLAAIFLGFDAQAMKRITPWGPWGWICLIVAVALIAIFNPLILLYLFLSVVTWTGIVVISRKLINAFPRLAFFLRPKLTGFLMLGDLFDFISRLAFVRPFVLLRRLLNNVWEAIFYTNYVAFMAALTGYRRRIQSEAQFSETLGVLLKSGVSCPRAVTLATPDDEGQIESSMTWIAEAVTEGQKLSTALVRELGLSPGDAWNLTCAEGTEHFPDALSEIAVKMRMRASARAAMLTEAIIPITILLEGVLLLFVATAILEPIFRLPLLLG